MIPEDPNPPLSDSNLDSSPSQSFASETPQPAAPHEFPGPEIPPPSHSALPDDLRAPWGWLDLLLLVAITVVGGFLLSFFLVLVFGFFGVPFERIREVARTQGLFLIVTQFFLSLGVLAYLAAQIRVHFRAPFWRTIGWRPFETGGIPRQAMYLACIGGGVALSLFVSLLSGLFVTKAKLPIEAVLQEPRNALLFLLLSVTIGPIFEETIFRGYIYPVLARSWGITPAVLVTGIFFGLLHAQQLWGAWPQIAALVFVGIVFTYVRAVTRTVFASYLLHVSYNGFLFVGFLVATHGLRHIPTLP